MARRATRLELSSGRLSIHLVFDPMRFAASSVSEHASGNYCRRAQWQTFAGGHETRSCPGRAPKLVNRSLMDCQVERVRMLPKVRIEICDLGRHPCDRTRLKWHIGRNPIRHFCQFGLSIPSGKLVQTEQEVHLKPATDALP
jgi:hypothetical protein